MKYAAPARQYDALHKIREKPPQQGKIRKQLEAEKRNHIIQDPSEDPLQSATDAFKYESEATCKPSDRAIERAVQCGNSSH